MAADVLIVYSTQEGHTLRVASYIAKLIQEQFTVDVFDVEKLPPEANVGDYRLVVVASSVHVGKHNPNAVDFARANAAALNDTLSAFVSVSLTARDMDQPEKAAQLQSYIEEFVAETGWTPPHVATLAGAIPNSRMGFIKRRIMVAVNKREGVAIDPKRDYDYTNWGDVRAFADALTAELSERDVVS